MDALIFVASSRLILLAALALSCTGLRADANDVLERMLPICMSCHGQNGVSTNTDIPALAGQHENYLFDSLKEYQSPAGSSDLMRSMIGPLGDNELRALANYFASQPYIRQRQEIDPDKVIRGREVYERLCQICHRNGGRASAYAEYPLLAGQNIGFMRNTVQNILSRNRSVDIMKREMLALVSPDKVDDAIHFFAAQEVTPSDVVTAINQTARHKRRRFKQPQ